jgi:hypothetical protein
LRILTLCLSVRSKVCMVQGDSRRKIVGEVPWKQFLLKLANKFWFEIEERPFSCWPACMYMCVCVCVYMYMYIYIYIYMSVFFSMERYCSPCEVGSKVEETGELKKLKITSFFVRHELSWKKYWQSKRNNKARWTVIHLSYGENYSNNNRAKAPEVLCSTELSSLFYLQNILLFHNIGM